MIKSIVSITFKITLSAVFVSILMFGAAMLALSFGKSEIENQLNQLVSENKLNHVRRWALINRYLLTGSSVKAG